MRLVTVCTHNRTRSVMAAAMLHAALTARLGPEDVVVESAGFGPGEIPAIRDAVDAMRRRDLDVSAHRSRPLTREIIESADLLLTAEREHVVRIAGLVPAAFRRSFTLPELLLRAANDDAAVHRDFDEWVDALGAARTAREYLIEAVPEIADPTGSPARTFERAVVGLEHQVADVVTLLVPRLTARRDAPA